jgi:hypothetical protein
MAFQQPTADHKDLTINMPTGYCDHRYWGTGDVRYAKRIDQDLRDWLIAADGSANPEGFGPGRLEAALRMPVWTKVFYALQHDECFQPATRLLLLASLPAHAEYLQRSLVSNHNFATMQMRGLGILGLAFPQFKNSDKWYQFAIKQLTEELTLQVYPDGVQKELTAGYHRVALKNFEQLAEHSQAAEQALPASYVSYLERMYNYLAYVMAPDGTIPVNNDSEANNVKSNLLQAAKDYNRPDWQWIATNGQTGKQPDAPPSRFFAWPGQLISRSGWDEQAQWSFFDAGVYGTNHQHNDKLHLSIRAHNKHLLVDSGRFAYQGSIAEKFRAPYARHSRGHNVILVDGLGQDAYTPEADAPHLFCRISDRFDFAIGTFAEGFTPEHTSPSRPWHSLNKTEKQASQNAKHSRATLYLRGLGWIVLDRMTAKGNHTITPLWHFHPDCTVDKNKDVLATNNKTPGNLRLAPIGNQDWTVDLAKGQETPELQGWYSPNYGKVEPATCAVYNTTITDHAAFGW